ncbi:hypothetical protein HOLleu_15682 [Holothuria leucospilota]|uniref:Uncharacterized protein n=1 Tax=Holothuria leucospilota TaxID=206669 RepID=A0A9Q1C515_HOLLE|nr:hypothetical protein HOLleu_15682 [Holothuria leucospilota]
MDDTVVWMEPYLTCHLNETYYNPEFKKGDPAAERMRANIVKMINTKEFVTFMAELEKKTQKYENIFDRQLFT